MTFIYALHLLTSNFFLDIEYGNFFGYINALHLLYLHHSILYLHHVTKLLFNSELFISIFWHNDPLHNKQLIIIYCHNSIVNIEWTQGTHSGFSIDMGIQDISGILFKGAIFPVGVSSAEMAIISFPLLIAFVLSKAQVSSIKFRRCMDSDLDIIIVVILAVIVHVIFVIVFVYIIIFILINQIESSINIPTILNNNHHNPYLLSSNHHIYYLQHNKGASPSSSS